MNGERIQRNKMATEIDCDGMCHCSVCWWIERRELPIIKDFEIDTGHRCRCGAFFLSVSCWNKSRQCYQCDSKKNGIFYNKFMLYMYQII